MQLTRSKSNIVEKVLRDSNGRLVRATFCVYECGGHIKARLLNFVYLEQYPEIENKIYSLSGLTKKSYFENSFVLEKIISPFVKSNILYAFGSKPRAPTYTK